MSVAVKAARWMVTELARSQGSGNSCFLQCLWTTVYNWWLVQKVCGPVHSLKLNLA